jgi:phenylacetate-CoA ligase
VTGVQTCALPIYDVFDSWVIATTRYYFKEMLGLDYLRARKFFLGNPFRDSPGGLRRRVGLWLTNSVSVGALQLSESRTEKYVNAINSHGTELILSFPSALYEVAKFMEKRNLKVHRPRLIVTCGETLQGFIKEKAEEIFGAKVFDFYSSNETGVMAGECRLGTMHSFTFSAIVESSAEGGPNEGEGLTVTPLHNFTMPLIRYAIGDVASPAPATCACGSPLPTLGRIVGRTVDYFVKEDGGLVHALKVLLPLFRENESLEAFQVIQEDYGSVRILAVLPSLDRAWQDRVDDRMRLYMGQGCRVNWELVDHIPKTGLGKYFFVRSLVSRD